MSDTIKHITRSSATKRWERLTSSLPRQRDDELAHEMELRRRPWSTRDYERVRQAALDLVHTHVSIDRPNGETLSCFNGTAHWKLLGALDRSDS